MAQAVVAISLADIVPSAGTTVIVPVDVVYTGSDLQAIYGRTIDFTRLNVTVDPVNQTAAAIQSAIITAVRNFATGKGVTIPAGAVLMPAYNKA